MSELLLGIDIGTGSTKGLLVRSDGEVVAETAIEHGISRPRPGWAEHDPEAVWWAEARAVARRLAGRVGPANRLLAVGLAALGPCLVPVDASGRPLRPAILYGVDTRGTPLIPELEARHGAEAIFEVCGMRLTAQSVGPKIAWLLRQERQVYRQTRWFLSAPGYLALRMTGEPAVDAHNASHHTPLVDISGPSWTDRFADGVLDRPGDLARLPAIRRSGEVVGLMTPAAAAETGLPVGTPVAVGVADTMADAAAAGVVAPGDALLMYGTSAFLLLVTAGLRRHPDLWVTAGVPGAKFGLTGGPATAGAALDWVRGTLVPDVDGDEAWRLLAAEAGGLAPGAGRPVALPYFAGERTPLHDPNARGLIAGLRLDHRRGDIYRAIVEGVACALRHNLEAMEAAGGAIGRVVAVGGGTRSPLVLGVTASVLDRTIELPTGRRGAAYGAARLAATAVGRATDEWVRIEQRVQPSPEASTYDAIYRRFRALYPATKAVIERLAAAR